MATRKNKVNTESVKAKRQQERLTESHQAEHMSDAIEQVVFKKDRSGFIDLNRTADKLGIIDSRNRAVRFDEVKPGVSQMIHQPRLRSDAGRYDEIIYRLNEIHYKSRFLIQQIGIGGLHYLMSREDFGVFLDGLDTRNMYAPYDDVRYRGIPVICSDQLKGKEIFCTLKL